MRNILSGINYARKAQFSMKDKIRTFFQRQNISRKSKSKSESDEKLKASKFLNYTLYSYKNASLRHLIDEIFFRGDYDIQLGNSPIIIDCGANIGIATVYFKYKFPNSNVISIEANRHALDVLEMNVAKNNLQDVRTIHAIACNSSHQKEEFYISNKGSLVGSMFENRGGNIVEEYPTINISNIVKEYKNVDLLKMDIEGGEWEVIYDLRNNNSFVNIKKMVIEYHHNQKSTKNTFSEFLSIIEEAGYVYNIYGIHKGSAGIFQDILIYCTK